MSIALWLPFCQSTYIWVKMPFLFKMPIQPLRLVLQQKQPHQQLHLNKVSFKLLRGFLGRAEIGAKKILYGGTSFVSFQYTPKLWLELQCSVYWLFISDLCHQLDLKNIPRKNVPSIEWRGGKSGLCGRGHYLMPEMWRSVKDLFMMNN